MAKPRKKLKLWREDEVPQDSKTPLATPADAAETAATPDSSAIKAELDSRPYRKGAVLNEDGQWLCKHCGEKLSTMDRYCPGILVHEATGTEFLCPQRIGPITTVGLVRSHAVQYLKDHVGDKELPADLAKWVQNYVLKRRRKVFAAYSEVRSTLRWAEIGCRTPPPVPKGLEKKRRSVVPLARAGRSRSVRGFVFVLGKLTKRKDW